MKIDIHSIITDLVLEALLDVDVHCLITDMASDAIDNICWEEVIADHIDIEEMISEAIHEVIEEVISV